MGSDHIIRFLRPESGPVHDIGAVVIIGCAEIYKLVQKRIKAAMTIKFCCPGSCEAS